MRLQYEDLLSRDLLARSHELNSIGSDQLAWPRHDAIQGIRVIGEAGLAVLGGDVVSRDAGHIQFTYDNWYCNPGASESPAEFSERSVAKAKNYVEAYAEGERTILYSLVIKAESGATLESAFACSCCGKMTNTKP